MTKLEALNKAKAARHAATVKQATVALYAVTFGGNDSLTQAAIHLVGINVTGVSVNPARSIGPALFAGGTAMSQLWVFSVAPLVGGLVAGALYRAGLTRAN